MSPWCLALTLARRDLRGGSRELRVLAASLATGVFAIAAVSSMRAALDGALSQNAQSILGGDFELRMTYRELTPQQKKDVVALGHISMLREMRGMARTDTQRTMVEVKAVDDAYPLYSTVKLSPLIGLDRALAPIGPKTFGAAAAPSLLKKLNIKLGERFQLGKASFELTALIVDEPDRLSSGLSFGPRLMISRRALHATALELPGALIRNVVKVRLRGPQTAQAALNGLNARYPRAGWSAHTLDNAVPSLRAALRNMSLFLTLVGLTALFTGGIGVANAARAFVDGSVHSIAVLKTLGASKRTILGAYAIEIGALALVGIVIGLALGASTTPIASALLADTLSLPAPLAPPLMPLLITGGCGMLIAALFALWALARVRAIPALALFRAASTPLSVRPSAGLLTATVVGGAVLAALMLANEGRKDVVVAFTLGMLGALALFRIAAVWVTRLARALKAPCGHPIAWLALTHLRSRSALTGAVMTALGLGLTVMVAIAVTAHNLVLGLGRSPTDNTPSLYCIDIQPDQVSPFRQQLNTWPDADMTSAAFMVRGRIVKLNGAPLDESAIAPQARWALRGDRGVTTAARPPDATVVTAGQWWESAYHGPPLFSVAERLARGLGANVGDSITLNIMGREIKGTIASLRRVNWSSLSMNFTFIVSPPTLAHAPGTWIATIKTAPGAADAVEQRLSDLFPNVSTIRVSDALATVSRFMTTAASVAQSVSALTLVTGTLALAAAVVARRRETLYGAVVLKVLGATRADILKAYALEYAAMGLVVGVLAALLGTTASWAIVSRQMGLPWTPTPLTSLVVIAVGMGITVAVSFAESWSTRGPAGIKLA